MQWQVVRKVSLSIRVLVSLGFLCVSVDALCADDWPQWRGMHNDGKVYRRSFRQCGQKQKMSTGERDSQGGGEQPHAPGANTSLSRATMEQISCFSASVLMTGRLHGGKRSVQVIRMREQEKETLHHPLQSLMVSMCGCVLVLAFWHVFLSMDRTCGQWI